MEKSVFAGLTVLILLLSSVSLYFSSESEDFNNSTAFSSGLVPVWERV